MTAEDGNVVGVVLGSQDATPLEFWIGVHADKVLQLDALVVVRSPLPDETVVTYYGVVDQVRKRFEGQSSIPTRSERRPEPCQSRSRARRTSR